MKRFLLSLTTLLAMCVLTANAQNDDAYEKFRKNRSGEFDSFVAEREAEYKKFKAQYETAFKQFKQSYLSFLKDQENVVDLMTSDDGIRLKPATLQHKPAIVAKSIDLKSRIKQDMADLKSLTAERLLPVLSNEKDSVAQIKEAAETLENIVRELNTETTEVQVISSSMTENTSVILEPVRQTGHSTEVTADALDAEFLAKLNAEAEQGQNTVNSSNESCDESGSCRTDDSNAAIHDNAGAECTDSQHSTDKCVPHGKPTEYVRISSPFGTRIHPITHKRQTHTGVDMAAPKMTPVYASADGTVTYAKYNGGYGNFVKVNHGNGYKTAYAHLHTIAVTSGTSVHKGDLIGYVGTTGRSTGNHLHYEIYFGENLIDPATTL